MVSDSTIWRHSIEVITHYHHHKLTSSRSIVRKSSENTTNMMPTIHLKQKQKFEQKIWTKKKERSNHTVELFFNFSVRLAEAFVERIPSRIFGWQQWKPWQYFWCQFALIFLTRLLTTKQENHAITIFEISFNSTNLDIFLQIRFSKFVKTWICGIFFCSVNSCWPNS